MTQLFDTDAFANLDDTDTSADAGGRHLRSIPTWNPQDQLAEHTTQWRLDDDTIEIGRRGIAKARQALSDAAKTREKPNRKAA